MTEQIKEATLKTATNAKLIVNVLIYVLAIYGAYTIVVLKGLKLIEILGK